MSLRVRRTTTVINLDVHNLMKDRKYYVNSAHKTQLHTDHGKTWGTDSWRNLQP
jgi:hypothetical protein